MDVLDSILADWQKCGTGEGTRTTIPAERFDRVAACVHAHIQAAVPIAGRARQDTLADARALLKPLPAATGAASSEVTLLAYMLRVGPAGKSDGAISFLRFWQAMEEVARRLRRPAFDDDEPLAEELAAVRDAVLRCSEIKDDFGVTPRPSRSWMKATVASTRKMSADPHAWAELAEALKQLPERIVGPDGIRRHAEFGLEGASSLMLTWLQKLSEDYTLGSRGWKLRAFRDVAGSTTRDACLHLGSRDWDIEAALVGFFGAPGAGSSWSSHGAKLRKDEVECPICMEPYSKQCGKSIGGKRHQQERRVATRCCFQVMCCKCHEKVGGTSASFQCPFCRFSEVPGDSAQEGRHRQPVVMGAPRRASSPVMPHLLRGVAVGATRLAQGLASLLPESPRGDRADGEVPDRRRSQ